MDLGSWFLKTFPPEPDDTICVESASIYFWKLNRRWFMQGAWLQFKFKLTFKICYRWRASRTSTAQSTTVSSTAPTFSCRVSSLIVQFVKVRQSLAIPSYWRSGFERYLTLHRVDSERDGSNVLTSCPSGCNICSYPMSDHSEHKHSISIPSRRRWFAQVFRNPSGYRTD